jgi:hypothetical protein
LTGIGPLRNIAASIGMSGCHLTGNRCNGALVANRGWKRSFDDPIATPKGKTLRTLKDAAAYIMALPKKEADTAEWQAAIESLMLVAELGGPTMFARIGVMRALNRNVERTFDSTRKDPHWGKRKLKRDQ